MGRGKEYAHSERRRCVTDMTNETVLTKEQVEQIIDERDKRLTEHLL